MEWMEPRNAFQIAEKMILLIEQPETREKMELQAIQRYKDEFSYIKLKQRYMDFYKEIVCGEGRNM
jgi:glycosyltransferase involved in cell wall biosynthesis